MAPPFERLSVELLIDIFEQAEISSRGSVDNIQFPFSVRLTHVCRRWRRVAANVTTLWNHISLYWFHDDPLFDLYIERSRTRLLDIKCFLDDPDTYCHFVEMLLPHAERWRNLEITFDGPLDYGCVGSDARDALVLLGEVYPPHLENLKICVSAEEFEPTCPVFVNGAPQLRTAILQGNFCFAEASFNNLAELELSTDLRFGPVYLRALFTYVSHSLVYLSLNVHPSSHPLHLPNILDAPTELPALRVLDVLSYPVLTMMSAPNLKILSLYRMDMGDLKAFVNSTPHYHLEKLILRNMDLSPFDDASRFILDHPRLESIAILSCRNEDGLWNLLRHSKIREVATTPGFDSEFIDLILNWSLIQSVLSDCIANGRASILRVGKGYKKRDGDTVPPSFVTWLSDNNIEMQFHDEPFPVLSFKHGEGIIRWEYL